MHQSLRFVHLPTVAIIAIGFHAPSKSFTTMHHTVACIYFSVNYWHAWSMIASIVTGCLGINHARGPTPDYTNHIVFYKDSLQIPRQDSIQMSAMERNFRYQDSNYIDFIWDFKQVVLGFCWCWTPITVAYVAIIGLHRFQILPILQVPSAAVKCIHKYKYRYRYMETPYSVQS